MVFRGVACAVVFRGVACAIEEGALTFREGVGVEVCVAHPSVLKPKEYPIPLVSIMRMNLMFFICNET